jgi:hypothetical protein
MTIGHWRPRHRGDHAAGMTDEASPPSATLPLTPAALSARHRTGRPIRHPAWPPFTGPTERRAPAYIAFSDRDHLVRYLRQRAEFDPA